MTENNSKKNAAPENKADEIRAHMIIALDSIAPHRSAWNRGVTEYATELIDNLTARTNYEQREPKCRAECKKWLLNEARDWEEYSYGGCALIRDADIAARLCNPSELRKTQNGKRRPNSMEQWLDVQARALFQAAARVLTAWELVKSADDDGQPVPKF